MPCSKRCFPGEQAARKANRSAGWRFRVYFCEDCRAYHVANDEKGGRETSGWMPDRKRGTDRRRLNRRDK